MLLDICRACGIGLRVWGEKHHHGRQKGFSQTSSHRGHLAFIWAMSSVLSPSWKHTARWQNVSLLLWWLKQAGQHDTAGRGALTAYRGDTAVTGRPRFPTLTHTHRSCSLRATPAAPRETCCLWHGATHKWTVLQAHRQNSVRGSLRLSYSLTTSDPRHCPLLSGLSTDYRGEAGQHPLHPDMPGLWVVFSLLATFRPCFKSLRSPPKNHFGMNHQDPLVHLQGLPTSSYLF